MEAAPEPAGKVVDLMAARTASTESAKKARGESTEDATVHDLSKKRTAKKLAGRRRWSA